jgi:hypothetical protein
LKRAGAQGYPAGTTSTEDIQFGWSRPLLVSPRFRVVYRDDDATLLRLRR